MRELATGGSHGAHRLPLADLTVAVAAQQSGLTVLHHDRLSTGSRIYSASTRSLDR
jgi:predicted nucleic acid-binding protein